MMIKPQVLWSKLGGGILSVVLLAGSCTVKDMVRHSPFCKGEVRTKAEITELADDRLTRFCAQQGIDKKEFTNPPKLSLDEKEKLWVIDYQSSNHFVRFMIDNCGSIETSFGPSEKVTKVE